MVFSPIYLRFCKSWIFLAYLGGLPAVLCVLRPQIRRGRIRAYLGSGVSGPRRQSRSRGRSFRGRVVVVPLQVRGPQPHSRRHIHRHPTARVRSPSAHFSHPTGAIVSGGSSVCAFARSVSTESIRIPYTASLLCPERMDSINKTAHVFCPFYKKSGRGANPGVSTS